MFAMKKAIIAVAILTVVALWYEGYRWSMIGIILLAVVLFWLGTEQDGKPPEKTKIPGVND